VDQHCNPTYSGVLSIGLFNAGVNSFILRPKLRIAQMIFEEIESTPSEDKLYKNKKMPPLRAKQNSEAPSLEKPDGQRKMNSFIARSFPHLHKE